MHPVTMEHIVLAYHWARGEAKQPLLDHGERVLYRQDQYKASVNCNTTCCIWGVACMYADYAPITHAIALNEWEFDPDITRTESFTRHELALGFNLLERSVALNYVRYILKKAGYEV